MEAVWDIVSFLGKALIFFVTFAACAGVLFSRLRSRKRQEPHVFLREISQRWQRDAAAIKHALAAPKKTRFWSPLQPSNSIGLDQVYRNRFGPGSITE